MSGLPRWLRKLASSLSPASPQSPPSASDPVGFLHTDLIPVLSEGDRVIYLGDLDVQGAGIEANTRRVIEAETGPLNWERLALDGGVVADGHHRSAARPADGPLAGAPGGCTRTSRARARRGR